jgi:tellurite resistance protein
MTDDDKWRLLQEQAEKTAKRALLDALLAATGLDEYIADRIADHERQSHSDAARKEKP